MSSSSLFEPRATESVLAVVSGNDGVLPTGDAPSGAIVTLPGLEVPSQRRSLYGFLFAERGSALYAVDDRATYVRVPSRSGASDEGRPEYARTALASAIIRYTRAPVGGAAARWAQDFDATVTLPAGVAVYGLAGRFTAAGPFALYTASTSRVYEVLPATKAVRVVATAPPGTQWRGVAFPPLPPRAPSPSGTATGSRSVLPSSTRSRSTKPRAGAARATR